MLKIISRKNIPTRQKDPSTLVFPHAMDAIFIINALLVAIVSDPVSGSAKSEAVISIVAQSVSAFEKSDHVSETEFFKLSDQFYYSMAQLTKFERVTQVILQEKIYIDRALRVALNDWTDYKLINSLYADIINALQFRRIDTALSAIFRLRQTLEAYVLISKENPPAFLTQKILPFRQGQ